MHAAVLIDETIEGLNLGPESIVVDATLGGGGHAQAILAALGPAGSLIGLDRDRDAVERCRVRLNAERDGRVRLVQADFADMAEVVAGLDFERVDSVLMDLGISSIQLDDAERGFSFQRSGPLDMRMDRSSGRPASEIVNRADADELASILRRYGEERSARRIARAIVTERALAPIEDTLRLAELIERVKGGRRGRIHPATKSFMALRLAVNDEIGSLEAGLEGAIRILKSGGRLAVISFHSLEDRLVKKIFSRHVGRRVSLQAGGERWEGSEPKLKWVVKKPIIAGERETELNPRARSAKLRIAERC